MSFIVIPPIRKLVVFNGMLDNHIVEKQIGLQLLILFICKIPPPSLVAYRTPAEAI